MLVSTYLKIKVIAFSRLFKFCFEKCQPRQDKWCPEKPLSLVSIINIIIVAIHGTTVNVMWRTAVCFCQVWKLVPTTCTFNTSPGSGRRSYYYVMLYCRWERVQHNHCCRLNFPTTNDLNKTVVIFQSLYLW